MSKQVFVSRLTGDTKKSISWLLDRIEIPDTLTKICIKPNLNDHRNWETASTCGPYILNALLSVLKCCYPKTSITIIENDAIGVNADNIFSYLDIDSVTNKYGCRCVNVAREQWKALV